MLPSGAHAALHMLYTLRALLLYGAPPQHVSCHMLSAQRCTDEQSHIQMNKVQKQEDKKLITCIKNNKKTDVGVKDKVKEQL